MRAQDPIHIHPESLDVAEAAQALAENWSIDPDVARVALLNWIEDLTREILAEPVWFSSSATTGRYWVAARDEAAQQKDQQLGPWLPPEPPTPTHTAPLGGPPRRTCSICGAVLNGAHPELCGMCASGRPIC